MISRKIVPVITTIVLLVITVSAQSYEFPRMFTASDTIAATVGRNAAAADTIAMANLFKVIADQFPGKNMNFNTYFDDEVTSDLLSRYSWIIIGNQDLNSLVAKFAPSSIPKGMTEITVIRNPYNSANLIMILNSGSSESAVAASKFIENSVQKYGFVKLAPSNCIKDDSIMQSTCLGQSGSFVGVSSAPALGASSIDAIDSLSKKEAPTNIPTQPAYPQQPAPEVSAEPSGFGGDPKIAYSSEGYSCESSCKSSFKTCTTQEMVGIEKVCESEYNACISQCYDKPVPKSAAVNGCYLNHGANRIVPVPYGTRLLNEKNEPVYCDIDGNLKSQKKPGEAAQNNHECLSNVASDGKCLDIQAQLSILQKIFKFFTSIFGGA